MLQKEVAERIACGPDEKEYGILSVFCRLHCEVSLAFTVKPGSFTPAPKVHSAILHLDPLPAPRCDVGERGVLRCCAVAFSRWQNRGPAKPRPAMR